MFAREDDTMRTAIIKDNLLITYLEGKETVIAAASRNHQGHFRWHSALGRRGRAYFTTKERALTAAAKQLGFEVREAQGDE